ncbi:pentatricopeptide repeat-containing protein At1g02150 [Macadamia integrifolia]|uniref:pentatricopeptide repeat-containing protein At1g02150 n=1 Tax=Macadamia integrifolia TaxID=60698 RepID=UPI001C4F8E4B|nr:pentatricopeptide repeat-containing protein At1g02150 [Macadamia integrifolia]
MLANISGHTSSPLQHLPLSSLNFYSPTTISFRQPVGARAGRGLTNSINCSISQVHSYGTQDYERRPPLKWSSLYRRISLMDNPELGASSVLNQWEEEGRKLTKWELCRVVKELRKFRRYQLALEVYEWISDQGDRFRISSSDSAIQLDLISKVHGISRAEDYFSGLPNALKDKRAYGALLNAYAQAKMKEKAEYMMEEMKNRGYAVHALPFNVMMTLYMNLGEFEKVSSMITEMVAKNVALDIYSYNIWLTYCGAMGSVEEMEEVFTRMNLDSTVNPNWTTYSTMATMYMKMGQLKKAEDCLKKVESKITGRDRMPYHYLLSLYSSIGKKEEIYRVWDIYKSSFPTIPNLGYHAVIASLVRLDDIQGAEKIYEEWQLVRSTWDPRICNLLMGWYIKEGLVEKAESFFNHVIEVGKANSSTWEILAEGRISQNRISEALSCMKEATSAEGAKSWRPKPRNVSAFFSLCEVEGDMKSREGLMDVLRQVGWLEDEAYMSEVNSSDGAGVGHKLSVKSSTIDADDADLLLNQLH